MERPDVDVIEGLSPSIAIEQKTTTRSPRSTVGTTTEIYDYLRVVYASVGVPHCPNCGKPITRQSSEQIVQAILHGEICKGDERIMILAPIVRGRKGAYRKELEKAAQSPPNPSEYLKWSDEHSVKPIVGLCDELLDLNRKAMQETAEVSAKESDRARSWMILLGVVGAAAVVVVGVVTAAATL